MLNLALRSSPFGKSVTRQRIIEGGAMDKWTWPFVLQQLIVGVGWVLMIWGVENTYREFQAIERRKKREKRRAALTAARTSTAARKKHLFGDDEPAGRRIHVSSDSRGPL
jgi:hypothetical protein